MHSLLAENPTLIRLVRSSQYALPVTENFWEDLAHGIGVRVEELGEMLEQLLDEGIISGFWGEPNPALMHVREAVVTDANGQSETEFARWTATTESGRIASRVSGEMVDGWKSHRWFKAGSLVDFDRMDDPVLLEKPRERTMLVRDQQPDFESKAPEGVERLGAWLARPRRLLPSKNLWAQMSEEVGLAAEDCRKAVGALIVAREWRRFAIRVIPSQAGWKGCGLASWKIDEDQVENAANALAQISATGDVCTRIPTDQNPHNLCSLIIAYGEGDGEKIARAISEKWGVSLGGYTALSIDQ